MVTRIWVNVGSGNDFLPGDTKPLPEASISEVLWHLHECNFTENAQAAILYNGLENYTFEIVATFPGASAEVGACRLA